MPVDDWWPVARVNVRWPLAPSGCRARIEWARAQEALRGRAWWMDYQRRLEAAGVPERWARVLGWSGYGSLERVLAASPEDLLQVGMVGPKRLAAMLEALAPLRLRAVQGQQATARPRAVRFG